MPQVITIPMVEGHQKAIEKPHQRAATECSHALLAALGARMRGVFWLVQWTESRRIARARLE